MGLTFRWVGEADFDRVAETRWRCYGHAGRELATFRQSLRADPRAVAGDFLLAEQSGEAVGTATSLMMKMWVRGAPIPCQGVAFVGTVRSGRRRSGTGLGVASAIMNETLRSARERGFVVSALMPFRASFYEHFGYGIVERRTEWTIPISVLPRAETDGWQLLSSTMHEAQAAVRQKNIELGQCDIERPAAAWKYHRQLADEAGMTFVHSSGSYLYLTLSAYDAKAPLVVNEWGIGAKQTLEGLLGFLATLADNYPAVVLSVPIDWPVNRLLRERQLPHRPVTHAAAASRTMTRMQLRILEHGRFLESLRLPVESRGGVNITVHETEGHLSRFRLEYEGGQAQVRTTGSEPASADFECGDHHWAAIATGDMRASLAVRYALAKENTPGAAAKLDVLARGPLPFTQEYF